MNSKAEFVIELFQGNDVFTARVPFDGTLVLPRDFDRFRISLEETELQRGEFFRTGISEPIVLEGPAVWTPQIAEGTELKKLLAECERLGLSTRRLRNPKKPTPADVTKSRTNAA